MDRELDNLLREAFARETAFFGAYGTAIRGTRDRAAREAFLLCQAASAQARGRLLAELERLGVSYGREADALQVEPRVQVLHEAEARQVEIYREVERHADGSGDARLAKLARELTKAHERRRAALESLGPDTDSDPSP